MNKRDILLLCCPTDNEKKLVSLLMNYNKEHGNKLTAEILAFKNSILLSKTDLNNDKLNQLLLSKDLNSYNYSLSQDDDEAMTEFLFYLAFDYYCLKQYPTALLLYRRSYRIYKNNYGDNYPITQDCLKGMMDSYQKISDEQRYA